MFKLFLKYQNLKFGLSEKKSGSMGLCDEKTTKNFFNYFNRAGIANRNIIRANLKHQNTVLKAHLKNLKGKALNCDALVTNSKRLCLSITVADCYPIYFFNPQNCTIGLAHCGWRGSINNLIKKTVKAMGKNSRNILVGVGPGIGVCHFEIQKNIIKKFNKFPEAIKFTREKTFVNLPVIIKKQLLDAGILSKNIEFLKKYTFCNSKKYFSYRREKPFKIKTMVAYISLQSC